MNDFNFKLFNLIAKRINKLSDTHHYWKTLDSLSWILGFKNFNDLRHNISTSSQLREKFEDLEDIIHSGLMISIRSE